MTPSSAYVPQIGDLGRGNFGLVLRALDTRPTSQSPEVAIKMLPRGEFVSSRVMEAEKCASIGAFSTSARVQTGAGSRFH